MQKHLANRVYRELMRDCPNFLLATKTKNASLNKLRQKLTELNLHEEFIAVLARKYNLKNPNNDASEMCHKLPDDDKIGHMLPETVGSENNLFEQTLP